MIKKHHNQLSLSEEYWQELGIKPVVVDASVEKNIKKKSAEIAERIKEAAEEIRSEENA